MAIAAAPTTAPASHGGVPGPSSSARVACHATRPAATAASTTLSSFPASAATGTGSIPKKGARSSG